MQKVLITIKGGIIQSIQATTDEIQFHILDQDLNLDERAEQLVKEYQPDNIITENELYMDYLSEAEFHLNSED
jgi:hypothetical protein